MKLATYKITALILAFFTIFGIANAQETETHSTLVDLDTDINLVVEGCNSNGICEAGLGENLSSCPADCTAVATEETTSESTPVTPSGHRNPVGSRDLEIKNLISISTFSDISFSFSTNKESISSIKIGQITDYEDQSSEGISYKYNHLFVFNKLQSNTKYFYEITVVDKNNKTETISGEISTKVFFDSLFDPISTRLIGPTHLQTTTGNGVVTLTWQNPQVKDFDFIRIMKTINKDTNSPLTGTLVYEGKANILNDIDIKFDNRYFYTLFAKYKDGSFAEGVSISALVESDSVLEEERDLHRTIFGDEEFSIHDFSFIQNRRELKWEDQSILASPDEPIIVRLKKRDYFGPIEDVFLEATFYNKDGTVAYRNNYKLTYKPSLASYELVLSEIKPEQFINFNAYIVHPNSIQEIVSGSIIIGKKGSVEGPDGIKDTKDYLPFDLPNSISNAIKTTYPWPQILFFALLSVAAWALSKIVKHWK